MSTYSVSRVNTYLQNPWKHWCKYVAGYKPNYDPEANKYMDRGTVFHRCMELSVEKPELSVGEIKALAVMEAHEKGFAQEAKDSGTLAFDRYLEDPFVDLSKVIHTEYELRYPISVVDEMDFLGYVDAIVDNGDGTVTLIDYKTYSNAPQEDKMKYSLQAHMYMYVATKLGFKVKGFVFDCVNPKAVLKGRAYKTKRIQFAYNEALAQEMFEQFVILTCVIEQNQDLKMYVPGDYMPDMYDYLYKVFVGEINEDLDSFIEENFTIKEGFEEDKYE